MDYDSSLITWDLSWLRESCGLTLVFLQNGKAGWSESCQQAISIVGNANLRLITLYARRHVLRSIGSREWIVEVCRLV